MAREAARARSREGAESSKRRARMKQRAAKKRRSDAAVGGDGREVKNYGSPTSGQTIHTRHEVLQRVEGTSLGDCHGDRSFSMENRPTVGAQASDSLEWLPQGWILETKTRSTGVRAGMKYKCYFDPCSGSRFYSKAEVLRFLTSCNVSNPTSKEKSHVKPNTTDDVRAQVEYSPPGLPHGWVKEMIFRKSGRKGIRRDPYYIDPASGYVFRSLKDAVHYVETGEISKHVRGPRKQSMTQMYSLKYESPLAVPDKKLKGLGSTSKRCLFDEGTSTSNGEGVATNSNSPVNVQLATPGLQKVDAPKVECMEGRKRSVTDTNKRRWMSEDTVLQMDKSADNLLLLPPEHDISKGFEKTKSAPFPDNALMGAKADGKVIERCEEPTEGTPDTSNLEQQKPRRGRPHKKPRMEKEKENENLLTVTEPTTEMRTISPESRQPRRKDKSVTLLRRCSRRLAGLEADSATDLAMHELSHHRMSKDEHNVVGELVTSTESGRTNTGEEVSLGVEVMITESSSTPANEMRTISQKSKQRRSKGKSGSLPRRSSRRLAGLEANPATDLVIHQPSRHSISQDVHNVAGQLVTSMEFGRTNTGEEASFGVEVPLAGQTSEGRPLSPLAVPSAEPGTMNIVEEASAEQAVAEAHEDVPIPPISVPLAEPASTKMVAEASLGNQFLSTAKTYEDGLPSMPGVSFAEPHGTNIVEVAFIGEQAPLLRQTPDGGPSSSSLPFGIIWSDPCIEFAVKTLLGEIPVLDEGIAIQEYVQKQLSTQGQSNPSTSVAPVVSGNQGLEDGKLSGPVELPLQKNLPAGDEGKLCPSENGLTSASKTSSVRGQNLRDDEAQPPHNQYWCSLGKRTIER